MCEELRKRKGMHVACRKLGGEVKELAFLASREEGTNHKRKTRGARRLIPPLLSFQLPLQFFEPVPAFTLTSFSCHNSSLIFLSFRYFVWLCL